MIRVCDAIMGSGKTESAISFINSHPERKFVYITPYLDEAKRIVDNCPSHNFKEPSDEEIAYKKSKVLHTRALLCAGENVASTHAAFKGYTQDMVDAIRKYGYTLIIDEAVDTFQETKFNSGDIELLVDAGYIVKKGNAFEKTDKEYTGSRLRDLYMVMRCNNLIPVEDGKRGYQYYYWSMPYNILTAFLDVYVMTYLFEGSEFKCFMDMYGLNYTNIGVERDDAGWRFSECSRYVPPHVATVKSRVHIFDNKKLNSIGDNKRALSVNWMRTKKDEKKKIKNNIYNYFRNYVDAKHDEIMWATYKSCVSALGGRGYKDCHVEFTCRAKNIYRDKTKLAYCVNVWQKPRKKEFFANHGIEYSEDSYALSTMIQWIWRSAIRDGKEIWIYIPSRRMRELLVSWLDTISQE